MSGLPTAGAQGPVWLDGELVAWDQAGLEVASFGLHNASCVFEGIRVYDGQPFALAEHCSRLSASARVLGMELPAAPGQIEQAVLQTVAAAGHPQAYVRPVAWHGGEHLGISSRGLSVHLAILVLPWQAPAARPAGGIRLAVSGWRRSSANAELATAKASCHYAVGALAHRDAARAGFDDALLLDDRGYVAEATGSNVFIVRDGALWTPVADAFLPGITRSVVTRLAGELGLRVIEARLRLHELAEASEMFLTGTASEIQPVRQLGSSCLPDDHQVTAALIDAYSCLTHHGRRR